MTTATAARLRHHVLVCGVSIFALWALHDAFVRQLTLRSLVWGCLAIGSLLAPLAGFRRQPGEGRPTWVARAGALVALLAFEGLAIGLIWRTELFTVVIARSPFAQVRCSSRAPGAGDRVTLVTRIACGRPCGIARLVLQESSAAAPTPAFATRDAPVSPSYSRLDFLAGGHYSEARSEITLGRHFVAGEARLTIDYVEAFRTDPDHFDRREFSYSLGLLSGASQAPPAADLRLHPAVEARTLGTLEVSLAGETLLLDQTPWITSNGVRRVEESPDGGATVQLTPTAAAEFARLTGQNLGRRVAILLDGRALSAPTIYARIESGMIALRELSVHESRELASRLPAQ